MEEENKFQQEQELLRVKLIYYELPNLLHNILQIRIMPITNSKDLQELEEEIAEIKKILNAECESALSKYKKLWKT